MTRVTQLGPAAIAEAAQLIREGLPVAVPTETVYGLAADAGSAEAVAAVYRAKGRPPGNPLIVHVLDRSQAEAIGRFSSDARAAAEQWWPGPLTLVVPLHPEARIAPAATAGLTTVALRCPAHPGMRALLESSGRPLAAPSANRSGAISPTSAAHVLQGLRGRIPLVIDGGPCAFGLESTIVAMTGGPPRLLRPGPITFGEIVQGTDGAVPSGSEGIEAPGQFPSHYAPSKPLRLGATDARPGEWLIGFGAVLGNDSLSPSGDLAEAAALLFGALHRADASRETVGIAIAPIPETGLGIAINDRLRRAAAPRPSGD